MVQVAPAHSNTVVGNEALVLDAAARYPAANAFGLNPGLIESNIRAAVLGDRTILQTIMEAFIGLTIPERRDLCRADRAVARSR